MRLLRFLPAAKSKILLAFLLITCAGLFAPSGRAEDLHYFKNYFVTGDYAVDGVGLYAKGVNGWATGTITPSEVPAGADIVAAYLYWETVETTPKPSSMNGYFDLDSNKKPYPIVGEVVGSPNTPPCWSQGGTGGPGTWLRVYRADVLRYLRVDSVNNNVRDVDYTHTVTLPDSGINQPGMVPHTEGASLVVVYRVLDGKTPYKAVVIYDGANTMPKGSLAFAQTIGGFYQASGSGAKMTQIVGNGQSGFAAKLTVNGNVPTGASADPFVGAQGPRWDNLTFNINLALNASSLETEVLGESNQVCLSWGAVLMSTNVVNTDGDGNLDIWKTNGLHLNVGSPATSTTASVPATFGGCSNYPKEPCENLPFMGAVLGSSLKPPSIHKDIFVQIDWMQGNDGHVHAPKLAALQAIAGAFSAHQINVHFDVGKLHYQQFANLANNYLIVPAAYAQGGNLIQESSLECPNTVIMDVRDCEYDSKDLGYLVLGWKTGIGAIENGFPILKIPQYFADDRKDIFHEMLLAHALAGPITANTGLPVTPPPSVSGVGDLFGGDIMVTLGLWRTDNPANCVQDDPKGLTPDSELCTDQTGTSLVQAGTLMHELGHNLGLHHGGAVDTPNCMVVFPSTMNYLYQTRGLTGPTGDVLGVAGGIEHIDFSNGTLFGLNENSLLGTPSLGVLPYRVRYYGPATGAEIGTGANAKANCNGAFPFTGTPSVRLETPGTLNLATIIDWSNGTGIGLLGPGLFREDIDFDGTIGDSVAGAAGFIDHNDWATLNLQQIGGRPNVSGLSEDVGPTDISTTDLLGQIVLGQNVLGQNVLGQNVLGQSVLGQNVLGQNVLGQNVLGQNVLGQNVLGQNVLGQNVLGEVDYDTAISTLDATGASTPLVGAPSAFTGTVYNQVTLTWGLPSLGQIRTYTIYRTNLQAAILDTVVAGTVSGAPPATAFNDKVTDPNLSDIGANCPSGNVCYDTNYQYYVVATDTNNNSSTPSNFVTVTVDHLYVTGYTGGVIYGNTLPNSMLATIAGLPLDGITSADFTCPTPAPRNVGSYADICTGPAVGNPITVGVTYITGTLTIIQRPLTIAAATNTKTYDGTTSASAVPVPAVGTPSSGSGLVNGDTVTSAETYDNRNAGSGKTLTVSAYIVMDGNNGGNYSPITTITNTTGVISQRPLTIVAQPNTKVYDSTTGASAIPTAAPGTSTTGLVNGDTLTAAETYDTRNAGSGKTLSVSAYTVNDGNNGGNYFPATTITNTTGVINQRALTIAAQPNTKIYDGTTSASAIPGAVTATSSTGLVLSDSVTGPAETYASPNVSNNDTLSVSAFTVNDGNSGNNYTVNFTNAVGTITQRPLTIAAVTYTKTYDGTPIAMMSPVATNLVTPRDYVTGLTEVFASAAAGPETLMVALYTVNDGNNGNNYSVTLVSAPGTINQFPLTPSETGVDKVYDSTTTGTVTFSDNRIQNVGDTFTYNYTANFAAPNVGTGIVVSVTGISLTGPGAGNYTLGNTTTGSTSANITSAPLIAIVTGTESGGPPPTTFTVATVTYSGFVGPDTSAIVIGTASCNVSAAADTAGNYPISCSGLSAPNYNISYSYSVGSVNVSPAPLTVAVNGTQPVGGTPTFTVTYSGFVGSDTAAVVTGTLSCTTNATPASPVGSYAILSCSGLSAPNTYTITYWVGTVNVM